MNQGTYGKDLRERAIKYVLQGGSKRQACKTYRIGHNTMYRWLRDYKATKSFSPKKRTQYYNKHKDEALKQLVAKRADATLMEMAKSLRLSHMSIWRSLERLGLTRKKKQHLQRA
jgi:transposase